MMTSAQKKAVIDAQDRSEKVEIRNRTDLGIHCPFVYRVSNHPVWEEGLFNFNFAMYDYRIKPRYPAILIAGFKAEVREDGIQVGCTWVTKDEVARAFRALFP